MTDTTGAGAPRLWQALGLLARAAMREKMQYKFSFLVSSGIRGIAIGIDFALVAVILYRFRFIDGWDIYQVALLYGPGSAAHGLFRIVANEIETFENYLINGTYDSILIRPWPTLFTLLARKMDFNRLGIAAQGLLITAVGAANLLHRGLLQPWQLLYVALLPVLGAMVLFAISTVTAALGFWLMRTDELQVFTLYAPLTASYYPLSIYPGWLRGLLYTVLPMAFINYVPVLYLLGKGGGPGALLASPAVAALGCVVAYRFWLFAERHYHSTGS
jgi:ABC-2 type transport system permease protein